MPAKLGIVAGSGALPGKVIELCRRTGRDCFVLAFEGETDPSILDGIDHIWTRLGAAGTNFRNLREAGVGEIVLVGGLRRPSLSAMRPDWRAAKFFARVGLRALGDDGLLSAVIKELEAEGFTLVGVDTLLTDAVAGEGPYGRHRPDQQAESDLAHGFHIVHTLGTLDIGQAAIVQQGLVLGVEAIEGTDELIRRCGALRRPGPGGVLIKAKKPGQERRADLPTIGPRTIELAHEAGLRGIAIQAGSSLIVDQDRVVALADANGLFVLGRGTGS
ncbi:MAG TPA: UDP-2,3-diacylglucosamine diphosphatase LpxI [Aliidongia sp.]|nr:UDP-2,3-diacylglucosamine diphosphatase LpxI [Aliidongia sp.]